MMEGEILKKTITLLSVLGIIFNSTVYASDLSEWALADYEMLSKGGILTYDVISENLGENIKRREVCTMLVNLYEQMTISKISETENPFEDTDDEYVIKAYSVGIISGKSESIFDPEGDVTRQEFAKMILNMLSAAQVEFEIEDDIAEEVLEKYDDSGNVAEWAKKAVAVNIKTGIINGTTEKTITPAGGTTREQAICMVNRVYDKFVKNKKYYDVPYLLDYQQGALGEIKFMWDEILGTKKYTFIIKDADAEIMEAFETTANSATIYGDDYLPGLYTIIIGAVNKEGIGTYSNPTDIEFAEIKYESTVNENLSLSEKEARVFPSGQAFQNVEEAELYMTSVTVPVWKLKSNGEKYSSKMSLTVNQALAEDVVNIFTEIYNSPEQFPIKDVGGYYWRNTASGNLSQHSYGTCIDINADENYYVRPDGTPIVGSYWKPYEDPYSIPEDGIVVKTFAKYGWEWGGNCWGDSYSKDYMHFTYLGK